VIFTILRSQNSNLDLSSSLRYNKLMKKPSLFAIFAHPDDEAFGPAGTLAKYTETHDVYIICATRGDAGLNDSGNNEASIDEIRELELRQSADILGVENVFFLDYKDGSLNNNQYHAVAEDIQRIIDEYRPEILLTYENRGVSGHLDHVAISLITHFVFHTVEYTKTLMSYVILKELSNSLRDYFIYVPHGFVRDEVDLIIDTTAFWPQKKQSIEAHKSQLKDRSRMLSVMEDAPKEEYFLIEEKPQQE